MTKNEKELLCLNAIKSINCAAKALEVSAKIILRLQDEIDKPDLKVVEDSGLTNK